MTAPVRCAAIDCGTSSIRLLIADVDGAAVTDVVRETRIVRLGEGVDRTGRLAPTALERTRVALVDYAAAIRAHAAERVRMVATSATRDARNRQDFVAMVCAELGVAPEVIDGAEEAALSFAGAASVYSETETAPGPLLVADIGGGSTELVRGDGGALCSFSMDVGCVRLTERHLHDDPPPAAQVAAAVSDIRIAIEAARRHVPLNPAVTLIGVAGTVLTLAALVFGVERYDEAAVHGTTMSAAQVREVTGMLLAMTRAQRRALPAMHPGRADVIGAGALVLRTLVEEIGVDAVTASGHDVLDGIVLRLAGR
ncbi:MAG TPA: Ppx/GppA phosphatase family protein [Jatrophihabitans sp.]|nr:Ppx/GppA phosphatase family protein [Jatrophihabitans sp.]